MTDTLLSQLAALEQSTDPEQREVGARLRTAIRNVLLDLIKELDLEPKYAHGLASSSKDGFRCYCGQVFNCAEDFRNHYQDWMMSFVQQYKPAHTSESV